MSSNIVRRLFIIFFIAIACLVVILPLLRPGFPVTDDSTWMIVRLSAFYQSFRDGQFPVRFLGRLNFSYGYPVANFNYPGFLYIGSLLHVFGLTFQNVVKVIMGGSIIVGAVALYFWLRHFFDEIASTAGAVSFLFMPYVFYDLYKRGSVGEILAIGVCMVAILAIEKKSRWAIPPVITLLAISHNTLALFFLSALFFYILVKRFWSLLGPFFLGIAMSAFFWLPAIFEQNIVLFNGVSVSNPAQYFAAGRQLIVAGIPFLIACFLALFIGSKTYRRERWFFFTLLVGSTLLATDVTASLWKIEPFARVIQFPYRFFALWIFAGPWFIADVSDSGSHAKRWILGILAVFSLFMFVLPYQSSQSIVRPEGYFTTNESTTTIANEYMPKWVNIYPTQRTPDRLEVLQGNAGIEERRVTTNTIDVIIHAKEESVLQINTIYYPGWGVMVDNKPAEISYDNPYGLMRITIPSGDHAVYMAFRETTGRFVADVISAASFVLYIIFYVILNPVRRSPGTVKRNKSKK